MKISILLLALVAGSFAANIDLAEPEQELQDTLIEDDDTDDEDDFEEDDEQSSLLNSLTFLQGRTGVCAGMAKGSCSKKGGECVAAPFVDNCKAIHGDIGKLKKRSCMSKDCQCCVPPPSCDGKIKKSCSKNGGSCIVQPFKSNCKGGKLDKKSCKGKHCQCCIPEIKETEIKEIEFESIGGEAKSTSAWNEDSQDWIASNAFTGQKHGWHNARGTSLPQNLWYEFDSPMRITWFSFQTRTDGHRLYEGPSSYNFWGSNGDDCSNELTWDILFSDLSDTAFDVDNTAKDAHVNNQNYYKCYGFQVVKSKQGTYSAIANVQMHHSPAGWSVYACEGTELSIECDIGHVINVNYANYGRTSINICPNGPRSTTNCKSGISRQALDDRCSGQNSCNVSASNGIFGDPCGGTYKYLEVHYTCEPVINE